MMETRAYRLYLCVWEITLACSFHCAHCGSRAGKARPNELTCEECLDVVEQLAGLGCKRVALIGGEVFLRPDWLTIAKSITAHGMRCAVVTNGFLIDERVTQGLLDARIESVGVSVDGTEALHDAQRTPGSFQKALGAIRALVAAGIPTSTITTLRPQTVGCLEELYGQLRGTGIFAWQLQACSPMGNAARFGEDVRIDAAKTIGFVERHLGDAPFLLGVADNMGYYTPSEGRIRGNPSGGARFAGCSAGLSVIGIDSVGNVRGCESMYDDAFNEGNLRERSLRSIWESPDAFAYNRRFNTGLLTGACASCPHGSVCAGGCRSYNHFTTGKLYESPICARLARCAD